MNKALINFHARIVKRGQRPISMVPKHLQKEVQKVVDSMEDVEPLEGYEEKTETRLTLIGNLRSKIFHNSDCKSLPHDHNQKEFCEFKDREYAIEQGFTSCGLCNP